MAVTTTATAVFRCDVPGCESSEEKVIQDASLREMEDIADIPPDGWHYHNTGSPSGLVCPKHLYTYNGGRYDVVLNSEDPHE